jgi:hypothetical protein
MPLRRISLIAALLWAGALPAAAQTASPSAAADTQDNFQQQKRDTIACDGPFAKDTSHAKLVAAFGAKNVTFKEVDGAEGSKDKATVLIRPIVSSCSGMTTRTARGRASSMSARRRSGSVPAASATA